MSFRQDLESGALALGLAVAACRSPEPRAGIADVSRDLNARTGHGLPGGEREDLALPPEVALEDGLDEGEAVAVALWRSPGFATTLAALGIARAELVEAGLLRDPILAFLFPLGPKQYEWTLTLPLELFLQRPRRVELAQLDLERTATELVRHGLDLALETRLAYVEVVAAEERAQAGWERRELARELLRIAEQRFQAGDAEAAALERARLLASRAEIEARQLGAERSRARLDLEGILGMEIGAEAAILHEHSFAPLPAECSEGRLLAAALSARPEVRAAELAVESAAEGVGLARTEAWKLSASLDANEKGSEGFEMGPGLSLSLPLLSGGRGASARAEARLEQAARARLATGARVRTEVRAARARHESCLVSLQEHQERVDAAAQRLLELAQRAHALGASSPSEFLEIRLATLDARRERIELEARLARARAELERSVGCGLERLSAFVPEEDEG